MLRVVLTMGALGAAVALSMALSGSSAVTETFHSHPIPVPHAPPIERKLEVGWRPDEALTQLGRKLFFDTRLSTTGATAGARCHSPNYAFAEPRRASVSDNGQHGRRNTPSLLDVGFLPVFTWDGRFRSLEEQVFGPFASGEMGITIDEAARRLAADR